MSTLFISDLHLHPSRPAIIDCFTRFLATRCRGIRALYILGDLFEAWIGDDDPEPAYIEVRAALRQCVEAGTPVYVMHGNRDFLLGERFAADTGCTLIADPTRLDLYGIATLLMHGDALCTDDLEYQAMRKKLRDPQWQKQALSLPVKERLELAVEARELSLLSNQGKDQSIMDVNPDEVLRVIREYSVRLLIHGHTHRPAIHQINVQGISATRIDLGDWYESASALMVDAGGWRMEKL